MKMIIYCRDEDCQGQYIIKGDSHNVVEVNNYRSYMTSIKCDTCDDVKTVRVEVIK